MDRTQLQIAVNQALSTREIGRKFNVSQSNVRHWLKKFGLTTKPISNSPFDVNGKLHKICPKCEQTLEVTHDTFYFKNNEVTYAWCKQCCNSNSYNRQRLMKEKAVDYKGGKCQICGYNRYIGALEFHHLDPSKKDFGIAAAGTCSWKKIRPELDKTVLVCRNCHAEVHGNLVAPPGNAPGSTV